MSYARTAVIGAVVATAVLLAGTAAWAGNCGDTAGAGGTRVACACGDVVVTDTTLKSTDPVVSTGPGDVCGALGLRALGLLFGAPDLTLDCKGLTVRGSGGSGVGIIDSGLPGSTIRGCGVVAFNSGIVLQGTGSTVVNSKVVGNNIGIQLVGTSQRAERNQAEGNTVGINLASSGNVAAQNRAIGNAFGLVVLGSGHLVSANITDGNSQVGIAVIGGPNIVEGNRGKDNGGHGIAVSAPGNTLRRNVYDTNGGHGICAVAGTTDAGGNRGTDNALAPDVDFACTP